MDGFSAWTRLKNDQIREESETSQSSAPLRYVTFLPDYLEKESCVRGVNANNCRVYADDAGQSFPRIGQLTNYRELGKESTNVPTLGVPTAPRQANGPLLVDDQLAFLSDLKGQHQTFAKSCDITVDGQPSAHQLDMAVRIQPEEPTTYASRLQPREDTFMSSRVQRRQAWSQACTPRSAKARVSE